MNRTIITALALTALVIPAPAALAASKTDKKQSRQIAALQRSVKALQRSNTTLAATNATLRTDVDAVTGAFVGFFGCLRRFDLIQYGNVAGTFTDGYAYTNLAATSFFTSAMAPPQPGDEPFADSFLVYVCGTAAAAGKGRFAAPLIAAAPRATPRDARP